MDRPQPLMTNEQLLRLTHGKNLTPHELTAVRRLVGLSRKNGMGQEAYEGLISKAFEKLTGNSPHR